MMKRMVVLLCLLSFAGSSMGFAADEPIGWLFKKKIEDKVPVKVYIKEVVNQSGQNQVMPEVFKTELVNSLHERRSIKFEVVNTPDESDIQIAALIKSYRYMDRGPFKLSPGVDTMILDAAATMTENYVDMAVEYTVADTKSGKELWKGNINEYIKQKMTAEESTPLIYDVVARTFIWKCFGKANLRESKSHDLM